MHQQQFSYLLILLVCFFTITGHAQFIDATEVFHTEVSQQSEQFGNGISVFDFDKDGYDDVTLADNMQGVALYKNVNGDSLELFQYLYYPMDVKQIAWVDYDNDDDYDLHFTSVEAGLHLFNNNGFFIFTDVTPSLGEINGLAGCYGSSWADYDKDGWLDLFACVYYYGTESVIPNLLFHNNGNGTFEEVGNLMGVDSYANNAFQSVWIDFDQDTWLDLYVINDHSIGNELYLNQQGQSFLDVSVVTGANAHLDAMSNSISDYDNDGDFDIYITNSSVGNLLLNNDNMIFSDVAEQLDVATSDAGWSALWLDFDHDGWEDLQVCTANYGNPHDYNPMFRNEEGASFDGFLTEPYELVSFSSAKGDFNNDGYWDYMTTNLNGPITTVMINEGGNNHWLKLGLAGVVSNHDAIGTFIEYFVNNERRITQSQCGEDFISQNSQYEILSLGEFNTMDSLIIHWPLGWVDKYYNLGGDQFYSFTEGETYLCEITSSAGNQLCTAGGSLTLSAGEHLSYLWSDASTSLSLDVNAAGIYEVTVTNEYGLQATATFEVVYYNELEVEISTQQPLCAASSDGTISIIADDEQVTNILWSNEQSGLQLQNLSQGEYTYQLTDMNGCEYENTIILADPAPVVASVTAENILCNGGTTVLSAAASGGTGAYTLQWSLSDPTQAPAGEHSLTVTDANGCSALHIITLDEPSLIVIDNNTQAVCNGEYTAADVSTTGGTGALQQNWNGVDETHLFAGDYSLTVTDANGCATSSVITIVEYAALAVTTTITDANEGNNGSILLGVTGGVEPYTFYWSNGATGNPLEAIGQGICTCTITDGAGCVFYSGNFAIIDVGVESPIEPSMRLYPLPFDYSIVVEIAQPLGHLMQVYNSTGQVIYAIHIQSPLTAIDTTNWSSGVYLFCYLGQSRLVQKF